ncbi:MAG: substrate-binding domain-containing protein [Pseudomonadota bacterium]|nr:substrate-binding domain-containing protein [Pseudomonadota bacterium]MDE3037506.1 substrate-binding domain-containing protein [Pseudomonadota bacterium]
MKPRLLLSVFAAVSLAASAARAGDVIHLVGSGTVFPFSAIAAEQFGKVGKFKTPIVEATGTGGGFKLFCDGAAPETPDINDASRAMVDEEKIFCTRNGVGAITDLVIGYDGIVIARKKEGAAPALTKKDLFLALAREVPENGKLIANPYHNWKEINPGLPDEPIKVYGTSPASGTRDTFVEMVMVASCDKLPEFKAAYADARDRERACGLIREDGSFIEAGEDYNATAEKLANDPTAFAIFGYSFLDQNRSLLQAATIDGIAPGFDTISSEKYGLSRRLHMYFKNAHVGKTPGLAEFAREITSEAAMGPDGYMVAKGLVPLSDADRAGQRVLAAGLK